MKPKIITFLMIIQVILLAFYFVDTHQHITADKTVSMGQMLESDGLSSRTVTAFGQDQHHMMWIGTDDGLNIYNGRRMMQLFMDESDSTSLPDNQIQSILRDSRGQMWVGTPNGVARYEGGYRFKCFAIPYSAMGITNMADWGERGIMVSNGIRAYKIHNDSVTEFHTFDTKRKLLNYLYPDKHDGYWVVNPIQSIHYDGAGRMDKCHSVSHSNLAYCQQEGDTLWVGQGQFVCGINLESNQIFFSNKEELPIIASHFFSMGDTLFLSSGYHGLYSLVLSTGILSKVTDNDMRLRHKDVTISTLYRQGNDNLWIGYENGGFQISSRNYLDFAENNNNPLTYRYQRQPISCLGTMPHHVIGSSEDELFCYDLTTKRLQTYNHYDIFNDSPFYRQTLEDVVSYEDNKVWLVSSVRIYSCEVEHGKIRKIGQCFTHKNIGPLLGKSIRMGNHLLTVSNSPYLLRTTFGNSHVDSIPIHNSHFNTSARLADLGDGRALIVMKGMRMAIYDIERNLVSQVKSKRGQSFQNDDPEVVFVDTHRRVWIGTKHSGLLRFLPHNGTLQEERSVPKPTIRSIDEDHDGRLWISSGDEIISFDPDNRTVFLSSIPTVERTWIRNASKIPGTDMMVYGTNNGVDFISLDKIRDNSGFDLNITGIRLINDDNFCKYVIDDFKDGNHYTFGYDDNDIVVEFSNIHFGRWRNVMYQCKLEGYDKDWRTPTLIPNIHFHNLPAGSYTFRVRLIASPHQPPLAERWMTLEVKPSFLRSSAALFLYFLIALSILAYINSLYLRSHKNRLKVAQLEAERERNHRANEMNMSFFTNISHEFRNPLTMIAGPLLVLRSDDTLSVSVRHTLNMVCRNVNLMLKLIDQMLDFNQLETDVLRLKVAEYDVKSELGILVSAFEESAKLRHITIEHEGMRGNLYVWMDKDKFEKIMSNLLTNALKHTPDHGLIRITFSELNHEQAMALSHPIADHWDKYFTIQVFNNGDSIRTDRLDDVFKRYYQVGISHGKHQYGWGSGLGLYYVKRLVALHHGTIWVQNEPEGGVTFQFVLPTQENAYEDSEHVEHADSVLQIPVDPETSEVDRKIERNQDEVNAIAKKPVMLIIDDDMGVAQYIRSIFAADYLVFNKYSAEAALEDIDHIKPSIILTDVVMGDMDGYQFCHAIRTKDRYKHVPIILITAKSNVGEQVEGLRKGASAYITKPFDPRYLKALVDSQMSNFQNLHDRFDETDRRLVEGMSESDQKFMNELYSLMEKHLPEQSLNVTTICGELLISHSKFHYKLKELTGETPGSFFRKYKLNKAARLLREGKYNISEISLMTGFGTVSYFSVAFKKQFGMSPSEYK